jgi:hypothetical protein
VDFPLDFINIITFLLLGYLAMQFYNYVIDMAQDISGAAVGLEIGSPVATFINSVGSRVDQSIAAAVTSQGDPGGDFMRTLTGSSAFSAPPPPPQTPPPQTGGTTGGTNRPTP